MNPGQFVEYLHSQPGIDSEKTNYPLIRALCCTFNECHARQDQSDHHFGLLGYNHHFKLWNSGATTTIGYFQQLLNNAAYSVLVITSTSQESRRFAAEFDTPGWVMGYEDCIRGLSPRPQFVVLDDPLSFHNRRSAQQCARFIHYMRSFPYPHLLVQ